MWNLYLDMRRRPEWQGQWLVHLIPPTDEQQTSDAGTDQNGTGKPAPVHPPVSINRPMLAALLQRHHEQKYVAAPPVSNADAFAGAWEYGGELKPAAAKAAATPPPEPLVPPNRLPPDTGAYLEGLEWVLAMYVTGGIRDYRYSYPATSPLPQTLIAHLQESSSALGDASPPPTPGSQDEEGLENLVEKIRGATTTRSLLQPLIPAACALALLPARSRRQAASPLRHLMDADSPIAEIYAVCKECRRIAGDIRSVAAELDGVRKELSTLQDELSAAGLDSEGALEAEADLASAVEKWEAAGERLKDLLKGLSRSQQAHLAEKHPYKPFPTEELEAAVQAVPPDRYPPWERKLARFGREMLFKRAEGPQGNAEMAAAVLRPVEEGVNGDFHGLPGWLKDCSRFATSYPKVADVEVVRGAALTVAREFLPLHPYMQPGLRIHARRRRPAAPPAAIAGARGFRVPTAAAAASFQRGVAWPSGVLPAVPGALRVAGMPRMEAGAAASARSGTAKLALAMCARMFPRLRSLARACF